VQCAPGYESASWANSPGTYNCIDNQQGAISGSIKWGVQIHPIPQLFCRCIIPPLGPLVVGDCGTGSPSTQTKGCGCSEGQILKPGESCGVTCAQDIAVALNLGTTTFKCGTATVAPGLVAATRTCKPVTPKCILPSNFGPGVASRAVSSFNPIRCQPFGVLEEGASCEVVCATGRQPISGTTLYKVLPRLASSRHFSPRHATPRLPASRFRLVESLVVVPTAAVGSAQVAFSSSGPP
jgi:hypothetical protein